MAFCSKCGAQVNDGVSFCPSCGAALNGAVQPQSTGNDKTMAILAVIFPILFFLPLVAGEKTQFGTFWANQALLLLLIYIIGSILTAIIIGIVILVFAAVLWIIAIIAVCKGEMKPLPLIGNISIIK